MHHIYRFDGLYFILNFQQQAMKRKIGHVVRPSCHNYVEFREVREMALEEVLTFIPFRLVAKAIKVFSRCNKNVYALFQFFQFLCKISFGKIISKSLVCALVLAKKTFEHKSQHMIRSINDCRWEKISLVFRLRLRFQIHHIQ